MRLPRGTDLNLGLVEDLIALAIHWILLTFAVLTAAHFVDGIRLSGWASGLVVGGILGLLNFFVRPFVTSKVLLLTLLTLGLFLVVINAVLLVLTSWIAGRVDVTFQVHGAVAAMLGAVVISLISQAFRALIDPERIAGSLVHYPSRIRTPRD